MNIVKYNVPYKGLGSEFGQSEQPIEFATQLTNRFINVFGYAEKRQGIKKYGAQIESMPNLTAVHEFVSKTGTPTYFVSGEGKIWKYNNATWDLVLSGKSSSAIMISKQMSDKLIFVNGVDRNFYTSDAGNSFKELQPIVNKGSMGAGTSSTEMTDSTISNWTSQTFVSINDVVYNANTGSRAIITSIGTTDLDTSPTGTGATGIGFAGRGNQSGDAYEIWDSVELNIVSGAVEYDNVALAGSGTTESRVAVSGLNFSTSEIRVGDYIYNSTRNALTQVLEVSSNVVITSIQGQSVGDTVIFHKKAMPIATNFHVHYGRGYYIDARDQTKIRISGPGDPQDMTTEARTLSSTTIDYGSRYNRGEPLKAMSTFGKYFVAAGNAQVFVENGQNPIVDSTGKATDLQPIGNFTQGCISTYGLANIANNMLYAGFDGLRSFKSSYDSNAVDTLNISEQIKTELQNNIFAQIGSDIALQLIHYPRRNWVMFKVGSMIYNYNYTPYYSAGQTTPGGTFSKFSGKLAQQNGYHVTNGGDLIICGQNGLIYKFDQGNFDDDGDDIFTSLQTAWLNLQEPQQSLSLKKGKYIRPVFETGTDIAYTISVIGDYTRTATDSIVVTAPGAGVIGKSVIGQAPIGGILPFNDKLPLSWRGKQFRINITTNDAKGADTIVSFSVYGEVLGVQ